MCKAIYNVISSFVFKNPKITKIKRKEIISFFKNSIEKKFVVINLEHYSSFEFLDERKADEKDNNFILSFVGVNNKTNNQDKIFLATFNNKKEIDSAIKYLQNKYFSLGGAILKFLFWILILMVIISVLFGRTPQSGAPSMQQIAQMQSAGLTNSPSLPSMNTAGIPGINQQKLATPEQQAAYLAKLQEALGQMQANPNIPSGQQAPSAPPPVANPNPAVNSVNANGSAPEQAPTAQQQPDYTSAFSK